MNIAVNSNCIVLQVEKITSVNPFLPLSKMTKSLHQIRRDLLLIYLSSEDLPLNSPDSPEFCLEMLNSIAITSFIFTNQNHRNHHRGVHLGIIIKIHHHDCHQHQHHHRGEVTLASLSPKVPPRRSFGHHNLFQPPSRLSSISPSRNSPGHGIHCATLHPESSKSPLLAN